MRGRERDVNVAVPHRTPPRPLNNLLTHLDIHLEFNLDIPTHLYTPPHTATHRPHTPPTHTATHLYTPPTHTSTHHYTLLHTAHTHRPHTPPHTAHNTAPHRPHTPPHKATDRCVELLLADPRVDPNVEDANGISALIVAANCGTDRVIDLLMNDAR